MPGPFYDCSATDGFHLLKDEWAQKKYLRQQSEYLLKEFSDALDATREAAPERRQGFQLARGATDDIASSQRERRWERTVFQRWSAAGVSRVKECWEQLVAFQVPLFESQEKSSWGYVDLLGVMSDGTPVIVELKKEPGTTSSGGTGSSESPLRMVLEAASYAVALQKGWHLFREQFIQRLESIDAPDSIVDQVPPKISTVRLVGLAPAGYWIDWLPVTAKGLTVKADAWDAFARLLDRFDEAGFPVSFASLSGDIDGPEHAAVQPLERFPLSSV